MTETTMDRLNAIAEFTDMVEIMDDQEFTGALGHIVNIMAKPDIPPSAAVKLIVQLEAYSAKFSMLASYYTNVKKNDRTKKNLYYSAASSTQRLVDSLKYAAKAGSYL
jgi:streptomycin 6-kinase